MTHRSVIIRVNLLQLRILQTQLLVLVPESLDLLLVGALVGLQHVDIRLAVIFYMDIWTDMDRQMNMDE